MHGSFIIFFVSVLLPLAAAVPNHGHSHAHAHRDQGHARFHAHHSVHDARAVPNLRARQSQDHGCDRRPMGGHEKNGTAEATGSSSDVGGIIGVPDNNGSPATMTSSTSDVSTSIIAELNITSSTSSVDALETKDLVAGGAAAATTSSILESFQKSNTNTLVTSYSAVTSRSAAETPTVTAGSGSGSGSGSAPLPTGDADHLTVHLRNMMSCHLTTSHQMNDNGPADVMAMKATLTEGTMAPGATATMVYPSGWAGMMAAAKAATTDDPVVDLANGSLLEGSFMNQMGNTVVGDIDISYVSGYSVPITCTCETSKAATITFGCSVDLFSEGDCPDNCSGGSCRSGSTCLNSLRDEDVDGLEPVPFFKPCQGTAFTYARDDANSQNSQCTTNVVSCCIGTAKDGCPNWNAQIAQSS